MKLNQIQTVLEGLIKIPENALEEALLFVLEQYAKFLQHILDVSKALSPDEEKAIAAVIADLKTDYKLDLHGEYRGNATHNIFNDGKGIPDSYRTKTKRDNYGFEGKTVVIMASNNGNTTSAAYYQPRPHSDLIYVDIGRYAKPDVIQSFVRNSLNYRTVVTQIRGVLKHELTHYVQYNYLAPMDARQVDSEFYRNSSNANHDMSPEDKDRYYLGQIEFDPHIKTSVATLLSAYQEIENDSGWKLFPEDKFVLFQQFIGARQKAAFVAGVMFTLPVSKFFFALKRKDKRRYQLAVKGLFKALSERVPGFRAYGKFKNMTTVEDDVKWQKWLDEIE